ncbi:hypothetical protein ACFFRR_009800 [Megaselia abdita]
MVGHIFPIALVLVNLFCLTVSQPSPLKDCYNVDWIPNKNLPANLDVSHVNASDIDIQSEIELINLCVAESGNFNNTCSVSSCNYDDKIFYKFPFHNHEYLKKWVLFCKNNENWFPTNESVICSRHFYQNVIPTENGPNNKLSLMDPVINLNHSKINAGKNNKAFYRSNIFRQSKTLEGNISSWRCAIKSCNSILLTKNKTLVNLSCEHNHLAPEGNKLNRCLSSPYKCSVKNCDMEAHDVDINGFQIIFLMFPPKNENIWNFWVRFCNNGPDWTPTASSYICSIHFENDSPLPTLNKSNELSLSEHIEHRGNTVVNSLSEASQHLKKIEEFLLLKEKYREIGIVTRLEHIFKLSKNVK